MGSIGMPEIILIFLVVLLVFGAKRIPEIARGLGKGIREFKDATKDFQRELTVDDNSNRITPPRQGTTASYSAPTYAEPAPAPAPQQPTPAPAPQQPAPAEPAAAERRD